jgi:hypothetical protein
MIRVVNTFFQILEIINMEAKYIPSSVCFWQLFPVNIAQLLYKRQVSWKQCQEIEGVQGSQNSPAH